MDQIRAQFRGGARPGRRSKAANAAARDRLRSASDRRSSARRRPSAGRGRRQSALLRRRRPRRGGFGGGRGGGGGGFFGGGSRGRLQFSLTDTITFVDKVTIAPGVPGSRLSPRRRRRIEPAARRAIRSRRRPAGRTTALARGSAPIGAAARRVDTLTGDNLHFSPLATFDLRLFANPGDIPEIALKHPWLRGTQVRLEVNQHLRQQAQGARCARQRAASIISRTCSIRSGGRS